MGWTPVLLGIIVVMAIIWYSSYEDRKNTEIQKGIKKYEQGKVQILEYDDGTTEIDEGKDVVVTKFKDGTILTDDPDIAKLLKNREISKLDEEQDEPD